MNKLRHRDQETSLEVFRRWNRRRWRDQQREKAKADLMAALDAGFVGATVRWLSRLLER